MPARDLALLVEAAHAAGEIALRYWRSENEVWQKGADGPVSEADLAVDTYLREMLTAARPEYGWLSEETTDDGTRHGAETVFIVDPIDGTRAFIAGERSWAHSLAVVRGGVPVAGVVFMPARDKLYAAHTGGGATQNGAAMSAGNRPANSLLAARPALDPKHWPGGAPDVERHFRPSLAYRMCLVAEGRFGGMLALRQSWEWDIAAGALICSEAGVAVSNRRGAALSFNSKEPRADGVVAASAPFHADLIGRLNAA
ncbi:MAG: 3'(2'),5'-bisphosphate nucleotidase CysQ [Pseudomonadota bacterium]